MATWNEAKRRENLVKHGLDLADAEFFDFEAALIEEDRDERSERRFRAIGPLQGRLVFLVYVLGENDEPHVISLRRCDKKEVRRYVQET